MNHLQRLQIGNPLWAWGCASKDVNAELQKAVAQYQHRFNKPPFLVFCGEDINPLPIEGLHIESSNLVPAQIFYFALHGSLANDV